ncbi:hypothetical protein [Streptomyces sp. NPDC059874]|uniref:hypothetical protein n=1 Tax=Streptomyces sp. NPDC059874 TaxID=3346983 RepID=UPI00365EA27F
MIDLTPQQISDAKTLDLDAVTAVIAAMEERVAQHARHYATAGGRVDYDLSEDLAQVGRVAVWEGLSRFNGESVAEFFTFMDRTISGKLADERKVQTRTGVSREIAALFERCLTEAAGDPYHAEALAQDRAFLDRRVMSADMAYAARVSWQGMEYLDAPTSSTNNAPGIDSYLTAKSHDYGIPLDLLEASDIGSAARRAKIDKVNETLDRLPGTQQAVLSAEFGIGDFPCYGNDYRGLADVAGVPVASVESFREAARENFRTVYLGGSPEADKRESKCCTTCGLDKPVESFYIRNKATGARMATCSACKKGATKRFRVENADARNAQKRAYAARKRSAEAAA